jgi:bifunctional non-homologous end joining protein LigD
MPGAALFVVGGVAITSPDRVIFPEIGLTKRGLAEYYAQLAPFMLPDMARRPISLVRCPQGCDHPCFFQKHHGSGLGEHVHTVAIVESDGDTADYIHVDDAAGIIACVQMATVEFHGWGARIDDLERPDRLVFDLDPGEGVDFDAIKCGAVLVRDALDALGVASLPMLTGGNGIHVIAALRPAAEWPAVRAWSRGFAETLAARHPGVFTATMGKEHRHGRIFIDWMRNQRGATAVMPFSVRARPGAGVAMPLDWDGLEGVAAASAFAATDAGAVLAMAKRRPVAPLVSGLPKV